MRDMLPAVTRTITNSRKIISIQCNMFWNHCNTMMNLTSYKTLISQLTTESFLRSLNWISTQKRPFCCSTMHYSCSYNLGETSVLLWLLQENFFTNSYYHIVLKQRSSSGSSTDTFIKPSGLPVRDNTRSWFSCILNTVHVFGIPTKQSTRRNWTLYKLLPWKLFSRSGQHLGNKDSLLSLFWGAFELVLVPLLGNPYAWLSVVH